MGNIKLNDNNPLGLSVFKFTTFNEVNQANMTRYFNVELGDQLNFKLIYDYLIANGYNEVTMQLTPEIISYIKEGQEPYLTNYKNQYYALAGGIDGGLLASHSSGKISFSFLSNNNYYDSNAVIPTYEYNNVFYDRKAYYVDNMLYNGQTQTTGANRGWVGSEFIIERLIHEQGQSMYTLEFSEDATPALQYSGDTLFISPTERRTPNILQFGLNGLRGGVEWWDEFVNNSDLHYDDDPQGEQGYSAPDGGDGEPQESVDIPFSPLPPSLVLGSGIIRTYVPTIANMKAFVNYIYSQPDAFYTNLKKIWANPMEGIISFSLVPYPITQIAGSEIVKFCGVSTNIEMNYTEAQYIDVDCGSCYVPEEFKTLLDYNNYTRTKLFLPFIGIVEINTDEIVGATSNIIYHCDILTGEVIAEIKIAKTQREIYNIRYDSVLYSYKGNFLSSVPLTGNNYQQLYSGVLNLVTAVALPTPQSVAGVGQDILGQKVTVQRSGNLTSNGGALGGYYPYFIFEKAIRCLPEFNQKYVGYPSNKTYVLENVHGYTEIEEGTFRGDNIPHILNEELEELKTLLSNGVILP